MMTAIRNPREDVNNSDRKIPACQIEVELNFRFGLIDSNIMDYSIFLNN